MSAAAADAFANLVASAEPFDEAGDVCPGVVASMESVRVGLHW
jgi:hypothetical protein